MIMSSYFNVFAPKFMLISSKTTLCQGCFQTFGGQCICQTSVCLSQLFKLFKISFNQACLDKTFLFYMSLSCYSVLLSHFGTFLRSELKFSKLLVQPLHYVVTCAHQKQFLILQNRCEWFCMFMQLIMYNCLLFPTVAYMLIKIYYTGSLLNSLTPQNI